MTIPLESTSKRPVNLTLNEALVTQAKVYTNNLSATVEALLEEFVLSQKKAHRDHLSAADVCATDWNAVQIDQLGRLAGSLEQEGQAITDALDELLTGSWG